MNKLSLRTKIFGVLGISFLTTVAVALIGLSGMNVLKGTLTETHEKIIPRLVYALSVQSAFRRMAIAQYRLIVSNETEEKKQITTEIIEYHAEVEELTNQALAASSAARLPVWKQIEEHEKNWWAKSVDVQKYALEEKDLQAADLAKKQREDRVEAEKGLNELVKQNREAVKEDEVNSAAAYEKIRNNLFLLSLLGIIVSFSIAWMIIRRLVRTLNSTVSTIQSSTNQVASTSTQLASASQELSQASTEQAASLEQTAASLEEITSMIAKASENAVTAAETSTESHKRAEEGRSAVDRMMSSMDGITSSNQAILNQVNESNRQMAEFVKVIQDIGNKTKVINEIVFQTKLLSFNASVEAARAGEHGKGFAVVAEEVGHLAQMSGNAAKDISEMLGSSISKVESIVKETQQKVESLIHEGKEKVDTGVSVARECSDILVDIVQNVSRVAAVSKDISQASKEQSLGVAEINKAMSQLDIVTQQNASASSEAATAAEELSSQSATLKAAVFELKSVIDGHSSDTRPSPLIVERKKSKPPVLTQDAA